jgi:predicted hydrocarbon binding protein
MRKGRQQSLGFYFLPGMKGVHIVVRLKDVPGALGSVLLLLRDHLDILSSTSYGLGDGSAIWSGFGKMLMRDETEGTLKNRVERLSSVLECQVKGSDNGLLVDSFHLGMDVAPGRSGIVLPTEGLARTFGHLADIFGSGGETILFEEGASLGKSTGEYLNKRLGHGSLDWKVKALLGMYRVQGWGSASLKVEKPLTWYRVRFKDDFECSRGRKDGKGCGFVRGHLTGVVTTLSGSEFKGEEIKCRFRGDPFCEFLLSKQEA